MPAHRTPQLNSARSYAEGNLRRPLPSHHHTLGCHPTTSTSPSTLTRDYYLRRSPLSDLLPHIGAAQRPDARQARHRAAGRPVPHHCRAHRRPRDTFLVRDQRSMVGGTKRTRPSTCTYTCMRTRMHTCHASRKPVNGFARRTPHRMAGACQVLDAQRSHARSGLEYYHRRKWRLRVLLLLARGGPDAALDSDPAQRIGRPEGAFCICARRGRRFLRRAGGDARGIVRGRPRHVESVAQHGGRGRCLLALPRQHLRILVRENVRGRPADVAGSRCRAKLNSLLAHGFRYVEAHGVQCCQQVVEYIWRKAGTKKRFLRLYAGARPARQSVRL